MASNTKKTRAKREKRDYKKSVARAKKETKRRDEALADEKVVVID